jgi:phage-related protein
MIAKAKEVGTNFDTNLVEFFKTLPGKVWTWLVNTVNKVLTWRQNMISKAKDAAKGVVTAVVDNIKGLPDKMKSIGTDLVKGLWNGIKNMTSWVKDKIKGFSQGVLDGIKDFFGVASPSKRMRDEVGKMLSLGLAKGIEAEADAPLDALTDMSEDMMDEAEALNGLTLERQLQHTFSPSTAAATAEATMLGKLDKILSAIERGQILTIDGDVLVGSTADRLDTKLGQRQVLAARGAI